MPVGRLAIVVVAACAAAAALLAGCGGSSSAPKSPKRLAASPVCLPKTLVRSARLAGTAVDVSPAPGSQTANPDTQISFLGAPAGQIHSVSVVGSASGAHAGRLQAYSQGDGASFLPTAPFHDGERVTVSASIGTGTGARNVSFDFNVDTPYPTASVPPFENPQSAPAEYQSFATLPGAQVPIMTVATPDRDPAAGDIFTTNGPGPGQYGPLIYDPAGHLVWFDHLASGATAEDLNVQPYDGHNDITYWQGKVLDLGFGEGEDVVLNDRYERVATVHGSNGLQADLHEFQLAGNGVAYITAYNPIRCDLSSEGGSRDGAISDPVIQEIDMRTGLVRWEWHSLDHVAVADSETAAPESTTPWDWFHLNSIDPEPNGDLFISARSTWAGYQLRAGTGTVLWRLGGNDSSFKLGPGAQTAWQHDGRMLADGEITFFDDGSNPPIHQQSRGVRIGLDFQNHTAHLVAAYTHSGPLLAYSQGNMQTLANGDEVIGFGSVPEIVEYAPSGAVLFDAHLPLELDSYRGYRYPWTGQPATPPTAVASLDSTGEQTVVHASWNGATDVHSWRILAGAHPTGLQARSTMSDSGFESSTSLPASYAYVSVQALGSSGQVLGSSPPVAVSSYAAGLR